MFDSFIVSFNTVFPLFVIMAIGASLSKLGLITDVTKREGNNVVFRALLPVLIFKNVFYSDFSKDFDSRFMLFVVISLSAEFVLLCIICGIIEKDPQTKGALIHCMVRTNSMLLGLAILANMYGEDNLGKASIAFAVVAPMLNVFAVYTLEKNRGGKVAWSTIFINLMKNPVILATLAAIAVRLVGISSFPRFIADSISTISGMTTPVALLFLGASVEIAQVKYNKKNLFIGVLGRLIILPAIFLTVSILAGFSGVDLGILLAIFATPTAIMAYSMSISMESNSELTGEIVTFTTVFSSATIFLWIFFLTQLNLL